MLKHERESDVLHCSLEIGRRAWEDGPARGREKQNNLFDQRIGFGHDLIECQSPSASTRSSPRTKTDLSRINKLSPPSTQVESNQEGQKKDKISSDERKMTDKSPNRNEKTERKSKLAGIKVEMAQAQAQRRGGAEQEEK